MKIGFKMLYVRAETDFIPMQQRISKERTKDRQ